VLDQLVASAAAVPSLTRLLGPGQPVAVRQAAAELLGSLATREDAKIQAVQVGGLWCYL
jgi:hypothetical protein